MSGTVGKSSPPPRAIYDEPQAHLSFLAAASDEACEGQHFDRKEALRPRDGSGGCAPSEVKRLNELIQETVSAFTNASGGLLVLGVSKIGEFRGVDHLTEDQLNQVLRLDHKLIGHNCSARMAEVAGPEGQAVKLALFLARPMDRAICEEIGADRRAWVRSGRQNLRLQGMQRAQLERDRRVVDFERREACPYDPRDLDGGIVQEFAQDRTKGAATLDLDDLLYQSGATVRDDGGRVSMTQAGMLFFAANPQRVLPHAHIRLLRFGVPLAERDARPPPDAQRIFSGPITKQIQDFRAFVAESAFFKTYQVRDPAGGFREVPELPPIAVDEAVVNAVAHRDYAVGLPIDCEKYTDALVVRSPGPVLQQHPVPEHFSLDDTRLDHIPRNSRLMGWLQSIKDAKGAPFVLALREGTTRMRAEMRALGLRAPTYFVGPIITEVVLHSDAPRREAEFAKAGAAGHDEKTTEQANLFLLSSSTVDVSRDVHRRETMHALADRLKASGWFIDSVRFGEIIAHLRGSELGAPAEAARIVRVYPACVFQVRSYAGRAYLVVDPTAIVQSVMAVPAVLRSFGSSTLVGLHAYADCGVEAGGWQRVRLVQAAPDVSRVQLLDVEREEVVASARVLPRLPRGMIDDLLQRAGSSYDLAREVKRAGPSGATGAARARADHTRDLVVSLARDVFPLRLPTGEIALSVDPLPLSSRSGGSSSMQVEGLREPEVTFGGEHSGPDIRDGIARHGSYGHIHREIELIPVCGPDQTDAMKTLIQRLQTGKFKYRGAERTFSARLTYRTITTALPQDTETECQRLLAEHPEWRGAEGAPRIFLVHCPEAGTALDDETAPYYTTKRILLEAGVPCQMVDTPTLVNPDYKDMNLALNIAAKCGVVPWVLPQSMPDADFFVGLSHTQSRRGGPASRQMGFANVFDEYGRWKFYSGGTQAFSYDDRAEHYGRLVHDTLGKLNLREDPSVVFHTSAKFSREDRDAVLRAARGARPRGTYVFVWINTQHHVRLYDMRPETDGSLPRGRYVVTSRNQLYLSTTGYNPYRKPLGTPHVLEINVRVERPPGVPDGPPDLRATAAQILSLTKLNWASSDSLCAEPITTKYAGDIAYLTAAFMRQSGPPFQLHPVLERMPWFL